MKRGLAHDEIRSSLAEFAAGRLEGDAREALRAHLEGCASCRELVDTWRIFAGLFDDRASHPTAEELAAAAVGVVDPEAPEQARLERHLETCDSCRRQLALTGQAILEARGPQLEGTVRQVPSLFRRVSPRLALAASILIAAVVLGTVAFFQRSAPGEHEILGDLEGAQVIERRGPLVAHHLAIRPGASITLRGTEVVAFGEGFSMAEGTSLVVELVASEESHEDP